MNISSNRDQHKDSDFKGHVKLLPSKTADTAQCLSTLRILIITVSPWLNTFIHKCLSIVVEVTSVYC